MKEAIKLSEAEVKFLVDLDKAAEPSIRETLKAEWLRALDRNILEGMEKIYQKHINPKYVLTYHCGTCVFEVAIGVFKLLDQYEKEQAKEEKK